MSVVFWQKRKLLTRRLRQLRREEAGFAAKEEAIEAKRRAEVEEAS